MLCDEIVKCCLQTNKQDLITKNYNFVVENIQMAWDLRLTETGNNCVWYLTTSLTSLSLLADSNDISPLRGQQEAELAPACLPHLPPQVLSVNEGEDAVRLITSLARGHWG